MNGRAIGLIAGAATVAVSQPASGAPLELRGHASRLEIVKTDREGKQLIIRIVPASGWHTYWLNPGDAGAPPRLEWNQPPLEQTFDMEAPEAIIADGITSYGFRHSVNLIVGLSFDQATTPRGTFSWVMCDGRSCLPEQATFSMMNVPIGKGTELRMPDVARDATWKVKKDTAVLTLPPQSSRAVAKAYFFPLDQGAVTSGTRQNPTQLGRDDWRLTLRMTHTPAHPVPGIISVIFRDGSCASYAVTAPSSSQVTRALGR